MCCCHVFRMAFFGSGWKALRLPKKRTKFFRNFPFSVFLANVCVHQSQFHVLKHQNNSKVERVCVKFCFVFIKIQKMFVGAEHNHHSSSKGTKTLSWMKWVPQSGAGLCGQKLKTQLGSRAVWEEIENTIVWGIATESSSAHAL